MSQEQRYDRLKDRTIALPHFDQAKVEEIAPSDFAALQKADRSTAFAIMRKVGEQFGVFRDYANRDMDITFGFSRGNLRESFYKQRGEYQNYARMLSVFDQVVENAVGIEAHKNRYQQKGIQIQNTYVFLSGFRTDTGIVPVLLEVREYSDSTKSSLYVAASLREIEGSRIIVYNNAGKTAGEPYTLPASTVRIAELSDNVNSQDGRSKRTLWQRKRSVWNTALRSWP